MFGHFFGLHSAQVADARSAVFRRIAVQQFAPIAAVRHADAVANSRDRREIADDENCILSDSRSCAEAKSCW